MSNIDLEKKINSIEERLLVNETHIKVIDNKNIEKLIDNIHKLEIRVQALEINQNKYDKNWNSVVNFIFQLIWVVLAAYILVKLGLTEGMGPL
jgi:hypothetical protein